MELYQNSAETAIARRICGVSRAVPVLVLVPVPVLVLVLVPDAGRRLNERLVARSLATASRLSRFAPSDNPTPPARAHVGVKDGLKS